MEGGSFEKLPNGAYALGFVRSYADFLGLDRDEIARRVKAEAAALNARTELVFPKPISEGRMPSGVVLIVSLALAIGGYGLWYYHSAKVQIEPPRVEAVPPRLAAQADAPKSPRDAVAATVAPSVAPTTPGAASSSAAKPDAPAAPATAPTASAASSAAPTTTEPAPAPLAAAPPPAPTPAAPTASAPSSETTPQVAALPANPAPAAPTSAPAAETKPAAASPKQFGETDGSSRIIMKATADSWVQVRDRAGTIVFSRILRRGDTYAVPNRPGLMLYTGSAGALDFTVDGKTAPSIGRVGFTERNVTLDPERLLAGTATAAEPAKPRTSTPATKPAAPAPAESPASGSNG